VEIQELRLSKIEKIKYDGYVYDIEMVDNPHTFFANNILVHNTDSTFIRNNGKSVDEIIAGLGQFNKHLTETLIKKHNTGLDDRYNYMDLKFEKKLDKIYFGTAKKRYYGIEEDGSTYIKGMNLIRKDAPIFVQKIMKYLARLAVDNQLQANHLQYVKDNLLKVSHLDLGVGKSFSKDFDQYTKVMPQHVKSAKWANEILSQEGVKITHNDNPYLLFVTSHCEDDLPKAKRHKAICLNEEHLHLIDKYKHLFTIDYDMFMKKQIIDQIKEFSHIDSVKTALEEYAKA
jgi:DNA polymerase elongation subunit (family B)